MMRIMDIALMYRPILITKVMLYWDQPFYVGWVG